MDTCAGKRIQAQSARTITLSAFLVGVFFALRFAARGFALPIAWAWLCVALPMVCRGFAVPCRGLALLGLAWLCSGFAVAWLCRGFAGLA